MSGKDGNVLLRVMRVVVFAALILNVVFGTALTLCGHIAVLNFAMVAFLGLVMWFQTFVIRRQRYLDRPRPDYSAIAAMERDLYGRAFKHDGAPQARGIDPDVASLHAMMDELAERATARLRPCIGCGYSEARAGGRCPECYQQWKRSRDEEHRSNLRWERRS